MSRIILIFSLFLISSCYEHRIDVTKEYPEVVCDTCFDNWDSEEVRIPCICKEKLDLGDKFPDSLCGTYKWPSQYYGFGGNVMEIFPGNSYEMSYFSDCATSETDSGKFNFKNGILTILSNCMVEFNNPVPQPRDSIVVWRGSLTEIGQQIKLKNYALYFYDDKKKFAGYNIMLLKGKRWTFDVGLDSNGNGYAEEFNDFGKHIAQGFYDSLKLHDGFKFYYDKKHRLSKFENYEEGELYETITDPEQLESFDKGYNEER